MYVTHAESPFYESICVADIAGNIIAGKSVPARTVYTSFNTKRNPSAIRKRKRDLFMELNKYIDHTLLSADATHEQLMKVCSEAKTYHFASVCVNSCNTKLVADALRGSGVNPCVVVGFPLGAMSTAAKAFEAKTAVADGAKEIDMVINIGWLKDQDDVRVAEDIRAVVIAAKPAIIKVIIEVCLLTEEEKVRACKLSVQAGAAFVKTSTGFSKSGATVEDVALMRQTVGPDIGVKAAGGIRNREKVLAMIKAGANRIGASSSVSVVSEE